MLKVIKDVVVDAARATCAVYERSVVRLTTYDGYSVGKDVAEMQRAVIMDMLSKDDNLCEMLAGRICQIAHGV